MRKHIIFDFDGTIVDSLELAVKIYNDMADRYSLKKLHDSDIATLNRLSIPERIKMFNVPLYVLPKMALEFKRKYNENIHLLREFKGIRQVITTLKNKGYPLSIISSNAAANVEQFLAAAKLDMFDHIIAAKALFGKQSVLKQLMRKLKVQARDLIYIGDELRDIQSCQKAGVAMIAVTWGFDSAELLASGHPNYIAEQPEQLLNILLEI